MKRLLKDSSPRPLHERIIRAVIYMLLGVPLAIGFAVFYYVFFVDHLGPPA